MKRLILLLILLPTVLAAPDVYEFGEDYWFEDAHTIKTSTGIVYTIDEMMDYTIEGKVVGVRFYKEEKIPFGLVDVALIWGDLLDPTFTNNLAVTMENRHCNYQYVNENPEISSYYIRTHMSNNHLIPFSRTIFEKILMVEEGDKITISGSLVYVQGERHVNGRIEKMEWGPSSTTLTDTGDNACEIILVKSLSFENKPSSSITPSPVPSTRSTDPFTQVETLLRDMLAHVMEAWMYIMGFFIIVLLIYIPYKFISRRKPVEPSRPKDEVIAKLLTYYNEKGYQTLYYTVEGSKLKITITKNTKKYLAIFDFKTKKVRYVSIL